MFCYTLLKRNNRKQYCHHTEYLCFIKLNSHNIYNFIERNN